MTGGDDCIEFKWKGGELMSAQQRRFIETIGRLKREFFAEKARRESAPIDLDPNEYVQFAEGFAAGWHAAIDQALSVLAGE